MADDKNIEIVNKDTWLGPDKNADGTPIQQVEVDGEVKAEIQNKDTWLGPDKNADGTPIKEVIRTDE